MTAPPASSRSGTGLGAALSQGLLLIVGVGLALRASLGLSSASVGRTVVLYVAIMALVVRSLAAHPFARFGAANHVTTIRAALVALLAGFVGEPRSTPLAWIVVGLAALGTALDGVDGWLSRRSGLASALGARFDMEVDALLILVLALLVWRSDRAGAWIALAGLLRYLFILAGWTWPWMRRSLPSSRRRQVVCVVQIVTLLVALLPIVPTHAAAWIAGAGLATLSSSFAIDTAWLWRHAPARRLLVRS